MQVYCLFGTGKRNSITVDRIASFVLDLLKFPVFLKVSYFHYFKVSY